jgi:hypothetical protein
VGQERGGYI